MWHMKRTFFFSVLAQTLPFCHKLPLAACGLAPSHESWRVESCRGRLWFESSHFYTVILLLSSFPLPGVTDRLTQARPRVYPRRSLPRAPPPVGCLSPGEIGRLLPTVPPALASAGTTRTTDLQKDKVLGMGKDPENSDPACRSVSARGI